MREHHVYQEFLLNCPYEDIKLEDYRYSSDCYLLDYRDKQYSLFDYDNGCVIRGIPLTNLDRIADTEADLQRFTDMIKWVDELILINDRPIFDNPILKTYSESTVKAYLHRINNAGINCLISDETRSIKPDEGSDGGDAIFFESIFADRSHP